MKSLDLVEAAKALLQHSRGKPSEAFLRRATSTAYYSLFHCLAYACADLLIGGPNSSRSKHAWIQTYRALEHGHAKSQCNNTGVISKFPKGIEDFANHFIKLQGRRHDADYNPHAKFYKSTVQADIVLAEVAIRAFGAEAPKDRRAFCAWVLFRPPRK